MTDSPATKADVQLVKDDLQLVKTELQAEVQTVKNDLERLRTETRSDTQLLRSDLKHLEQLVRDLIGSLSREIETFSQDMKARFDTQAQRLDRQGALLQTGSRWVNRMNGWSEKIDKSQDLQDQQIGELREGSNKLKKPPSD